MARFLASVALVLLLRVWFDFGEEGIVIGTSENLLTIRLDDGKIAQWPIGRVSKSKWVNVSSSNS